METLARYPAVMVGRTTCAFSLEADSLLTTALAALGAPPTSLLALWTDQLPGGAALRAAIKDATGHPTQPAVFIGGQLVGGCDAVKALQRDGLLLGRLGAVLPTGGAAPPPSKVATSAALDPATEPAFPGLLWFPEVVDSNAVRFTAAAVVACCVTIIVCRQEVWAKWLCLGLAIDNALRFAFGPGPSPLGQLARLPAAFLNPHFGPGIPKQFAATCALFMSSVATIFLFLSGFDPQEIIASCFLGVYAALAFLEGSINFCMG